MQWFEEFDSNIKKLIKYRGQQIMKIIVFLIVTVFISGCASNFDSDGTCTGSDCHSSVVSRKLSAGTTAAGTVYSLPKQLLEFKITRKKITKATLEKEKSGIKEKIKKNSEAISKLKNETIDVLKQKLKEKKISKVLRAKLELELEIALLDNLVLKRKDKALNENLKKIQKKIAAFQGDKLEDKFELKVLDPVATSNNLFVASPNSSWWTSETIEIKTTAAGLLSGGSGKSEGNIDEIFVSLASAVGALEVKPSSDVMIKALTDVPAAHMAMSSCAKDEGIFSYKIDLEDANALGKLNFLLRQSKLCYILDFAQPVAAATIAHNSKKYDGLLYPRQTVVPLELFDSSSGANILKKSFYPKLIDPRFVGVIPLKQGAFADNEYEFEFDKGLLTRYKAVNPNEFISALAMIPEALKALISVPGEIIKLKVDYSSQEKAYADAKAAAYTARLKYEKLLEDPESAFAEESAETDSGQ